MDTAETTYLAQYRGLAAKKKEIEAMIADLKGICASLTEWQQTAAKVGTLGSRSLGRNRPSAPA